MTWIASRRTLKLMWEPGTMSRIGAQFFPGGLMSNPAFLARWVKMAR
ncbi:hypothetical protein C725_2802 [Pacificimonas flava]|uniref:Uncharacterized protein n=1 Tax=Pacificimonas flava TaxID=1234595 RepID=M2S8Y2_9SPHN|nr:hypothetical protein C725_2802 [Pacificimonas flava]